MVLHSSESHYLHCIANKIDLESISMVLCVITSSTAAHSRKANIQAHATVAPRNNLCWRSVGARYMLRRSCIIAISAAAAAATAQFECTTQSTGAN